MREAIRVLLFLFFLLFTIFSIGSFFIGGKYPISNVGVFAIMAAIALILFFIVTKRKV